MDQVGVTVKEDTDVLLHVLVKKDIKIIFRS
jgi:hypothetical protein